MKWVSSFRYLPIDYTVPLAQVEHLTQKVTFENNLNGSRLRLRLSNRYSRWPLTLQRLCVGVCCGDTVERTVPVTRGGQAVITLAPDEECWSDELNCPVQAGQRLAILAYAQGQTIGSACILWDDTALRVEYLPGEHTDGRLAPGVPAAEVYPFVAMDANKGMPFFGVSALQVLTEEDVMVVAAFGDSITHMSYVTNALQRRLFAAYPGKAVLLNCGIGGNRLLRDASYLPGAPGDGRLFGVAGLTRMEEDVFGTDPVDAVLVLEGINDIMHPIEFGLEGEQVTVKELADGLCRCAELAHRHGARAYGATVTPAGSPEYPAAWMEAFEAVRVPLNERLRAGIGFDGVFDYDAAVRDPAAPGFMRPEYHIGDGLHPNGLGGEAMAACVNLTMLAGR